MGNIYSAKVIAKDVRIAMVASRFNELVTSQLLKGAQDALERHSDSKTDCDIFWVPGSFELPAVARKLCDSKKFDGIVALGALIRGGTDHYDLLATEVTKGLANLSMHTAVPVSFGVLTCDTLEQALERAGTKAGNKGAEAMVSLIELINLGRAIDKIK